MENDKKEQVKRKNLKKTLFILFFACALYILFFLLRTSYMSDTFKSLILPELEALSGQRVSVEKIYFNVFPLFVGAKGIKVTDENGDAIVIADKVKGYISLSGILNRYISLQRLVIYEPEISAKRQKLEEIIRNVKTYLEKERKQAFKVKIKVIEVVKANTNLKDEELKGMVDAKGLTGELILGEKPRLKASVKELNIEKEGWPRIICDIRTALMIRDEMVEIKQLEIGSFGSRITGEGFYSQGRGALKTGISLIIDSLKRIFKLGQRGEGRISAKGEIRLENNLQSSPASGLLKKIFLDLNLSGDFYLQTLMELLHVREKMEGFIDFRGEVTGPLSDITGSAKAKLQKGNLFGVDIDSLACRILYKNGVMKFENGSATLYDGTAKADASINLPVVDFFTLNVTFTAADSKAVLKLIGWEPEIPTGKVDGELSTSGREFNPDGWFIYRSPGSEQRALIKGYQPQTDNVLNRIREIKGSYSLHGHIITLSNIKLYTLMTEVTVNGTIDTEKKALKLKSRLHTENISDLSLPYYSEIQGRGEFSGEISGSFDDPRLSGRATLSNLAVESYRSESAVSDFSYQKNLLDIREAVFRSSGEEHVIRGKISFPEAKELFDLSQPLYNLNASVRNAEFGRAVGIFYRDFKATGRMNSDIKIESKDRDIHISGKALVDKASVYAIPFDSASGVFTYGNKEFSLKQVKITKGKSILTGEGTISPGERFSYKASSDKLFVNDFGLSYIPDDTVASFRSEGQGTFDNPRITLDAKITGGTFKGKDMGGGSIAAVVRDRNISVNASLSNEKMKLRGTGHLDDKLLWSAELSILPGRYDFLVSSFLKDVPEDLQLNLDGRIDMKGDRNNVTAAANIRHLTLSLFGQTFSNDSGINFQVHNRELSLTAFTIKSGTTSFRLQGGLEIGKEYDLVLDGSSSLSPLKGLTKKIGYLKGDTDFVFSLRGKWEKPEINGGMNISDASFGLRGYPTYISSINGYLYVDSDKIVLDRLSGKLGGGTINIAGIVYLKAFSIKRFYLDANLVNIPATLSKDFTMNFSGSLLYKGTPDTQNITGDIKINRALYKQTVEWRTWLLTTKIKEKPKSEISTLEKAELNIRITGSENISIDNNMARAPISIRGDMIVKGTISKPILFGRLESKEGYVYFRNNEFRIIFASVDLADPNRIKPVVNLTAETNVKGYNIRLNLEGQTDRFNLALSSDPHLEEVDILSLLTVGQLGKQLKGLEGGIGAGAATSFITGKAQDVIEERVRTLTGLDRFQVEPYVSNVPSTSSVSKTTSTVQPRVTVSERLIGDKLYVTYTTSLSSTEEQILKVEYLLNKNISLVGVRDERGIIGGDIKLRFEFK
jgi:translocation and assembly module TamB